MNPTRDIPALVSEILTSGQKIQLQPADLAFLAALRFWKDQESQPEFSEEELHLVFETVDRQDLGALEDSRQRRCNDTLRRLLEQHLLICLESGGKRPHAYLLPPVSEQIVESICTGLDASQTALRTLFTTVAGHLQEIHEAARQDGNDQFWKLQIEAPLDITVRQLVTAIDHRQRQLDTEAITTRKEVVSLLKHDWQNAIARCEALLVDTQERLQDLQQLLLASCHELRQLLESIGQHCEKAQRLSAVQSVVRLEHHLDRIEHWSSERLEHWENFHQRTHQYLRQFINMDERKALMERTLDALQRYDQHPWHLRCAGDEPLIRLREIETFSRQQDNTGIIYEDDTMTEMDDLDALKEEVVCWLRNLVDDKGYLPSYEEAMSQLAGEIPVYRLHQSAGWLFEAMTRLGSQQDSKKIPDTVWHEILAGFEVESLTLDRHKTPENEYRESALEH
ncbi:hypothetical protein GZ77_02475 [Endozoicomonas montiporae]|uniref:Condesin subunit F n=2 Tax=Endozoicomonas montiporae TaxID=1027273 RepID=A0A081NAP1_9GAMM|nr:hypothetical protein [Endozoicomonas montiporae]AMO56800.1 condesin subunit F [Endozoicomonas montiporae CL-33]KEQ15514.1 hypothetical protein GZ77_02475 [Endozoicomonas montiporae]